MYGHKWEGEHNGDCWKYNRIIYNTRLCSWAGCFVRILRSHTKDYEAHVVSLWFFDCYWRELSTSLPLWVDKIVFLWSGEVWHQLSRTNAGRVKWRVPPLLWKHTDVPRCYKMIQCMTSQQNGREHLWCSQWYSRPRWWQKPGEWMSTPLRYQPLVQLRQCCGREGEGGEKKKEGGSYDTIVCFIA